MAHSPRVGLILRNLSSMGGAELASRAAGFVTTVWIARVLEPAGFGRISFAVGVVTYFGLLVSFGFADLGILRAAVDKDGEAVDRALDEIASARTVAAAICVVLLILAVWLVPALNAISTIVLLYGTLLLVQAYSTDWAYMATERMQPLAAASVLSSALYVVMVFWFVRGSDDVLALAAIMLVRQAIPIVGLYYWGVRTGVYRRPRIQMGLVLPAFRAAAPLGMAAIATQMYLSVDVLMIGLLASERDVGIYSAALRIVALGLGLRGLIGRVLYPGIARAVASGAETELNRIRHALALCVPLGIALGGLGTVVAPWVLLAVFGGRFSESVPVFQVVVWVLALEMMGLLLPYLMIMLERRVYMIIMVAAATSNVFLNLMLIPAYGPLGAGMAFTACAAGVFAAMWILVTRHIGQGRFDWQLGLGVGLSILGLMLGLGFRSSAPILAPVLGATVCGAAVVHSSWRLSRMAGFV